MDDPAHISEQQKDFSGAATVVIQVSFVRSKNGYSCHKAERVKKGGGKPPKPVDPLLANVLPLDDELNLLNNTWDSDHGHCTVVVENEGVMMRQ
ncbi:hypothetical protein E2C01_046451 [Portunus trituberculatus]|uniref:Uncharacterized protein n=1 Tax=Portunus trituberculatus TaxID=210409 RepID=A0A5B7FYH2_PORTR|nr:hypothetical protein [Portunus trituberculatus]